MMFIVLMGVTIISGGNPPLRMQQGEQTAPFTTLSSFPLCGLGSQGSKVSRCREVFEVPLVVTGQIDMFPAER